ncbi:MAG: polymer-forming cytoskeletal protein [Rhodospirillaceae bacterium]|jgi:cytoskeletal protein CcmA (bactofilin family)|nr:polymer-forming cytoskeletal protein [Rhodospirillaceae bacterium]MBT3884327.1 polymer-forming cytoskeletal protein [Rhodospirillaceae bacterium]MBT4118664.1 polymer-forming cytoskeletal protein [Rhodospirillaceae bacterium]MBT4672536.1 polymer-forming cytoskeletal protein [Rhodospirillaceae bacterium]MBT4720714.1 polymer-forming cytoskeletal protein [Rhodospirillaceae bacterium]
MFSKGSKEIASTPPAPKTPAPPSLLSTDLKITGDLVSQGELQVDGQIDGDIHTDVLIVGETAQINGEITADSVRVHGYVTGQIKARSVSLAKSAHVLGDILHENLSIEQGAFLEGHCRRIETGRRESEGTIKLLVKGGAKNKSDPPPKKAEAESA